AARDLALESEALPGSLLAERFALQEGEARLSLDASLEMGLGSERPPRGHVRASLADGRARFGAVLPSVSGLAFELEADLAPAPGMDPTAREAWALRASLQTELAGTPLWLRAEAGRDVPRDSWLRAWGGASHASLERADLEQFGLEGPFHF